MARKLINKYIIILTYFLAISGNLEKLFLFFISDQILLAPLPFFWGGGMAIFFFKKWFICVILMLYTEFQSPTMPGTCQKVCVGAVVGWVGVSLF